MTIDPRPQQDVGLDHSRERIAQPPKRLLGSSPSYSPSRRSRDWTSTLRVTHAGAMTRVSFFWYAPLGLGLTMALGYAFSLAFPAMDLESLRGLVKGHGEDGVQKLSGSPGAASLIS